MLYKAYSNSGAFEIYSEFEFCAFSEQDIQEIKDRNTPKAQRIKKMYKIYLEAKESSYFNSKQSLEELKNHFPFYIDVFETIGYQRIEELNFSKSDIEEEVKVFRFKERLASKEVKNDVYSVFKEGERYSTTFIKAQLNRIFKEHNVPFPTERNAKKEDIEFYFVVKENRTSAERGWKMVRKLLD